ncbi:hypothetical protein PM082_010138 [Marasmius tenuissimus]|nr:hypothetical protein PM082_010138 [Marasmius tenuissimus]
MTKRDYRLVQQAVRDELENEEVVSFDNQHGIPTTKPALQYESTDDEASDDDIDIESEDSETSPQAIRVACPLMEVNITTNSTAPPQDDCESNPMDVDSSGLSSSDDDDTSQQDPKDLVENEETNAYEVSFLVNLRIKNGIFEYHICWKGYHAKHDTWEPYWVLDGAPNIVEDYQLCQAHASLDPNLYNCKSRTFVELNALMDPVSLILDHGSVQDVVDALARRKKANLPIVQDTFAILRASGQFQDSGLQLDNHETIPNELMMPLVQQVTEVFSMTACIGYKKSLLQCKDHALQQAYARGCLFIYSWYLEYGPSMADSLVTCCSTGIPPTDYSPLFPVVQSIVTAVQEMKTAVIPVESFINLLCTQKTPISIPLGAVNLRPGEQRDSMHCVSVQAVITFLTEHIILPNIKIALQDPNGDKDKAICKGFLCEALLDVFDDDGIFCTDRVFRTLESPWKLWGIDMKPKVLARRILCKPEEELQPIRRWLQGYTGLPEVQEMGRSISEAVHSVLHTVWNLKVPAPRRARGCPLQKVKGVELIPLGSPVPHNTPLAQLCPYEGLPRFGILSLMLNDVLAFKRGMSKIISVFRRILQGAHLTRTSAQQTREQDHYNPIRYNRSHQLLIDNLLSCSETLTSEFGLSNILVRLSTGQGSKTKTFLNGALWNQWFTSAEQCSDLFECQYTANLNKPKQEATVIPNGAIWGTYCYQLSLDSRRNGEPPEFADKFRELFNDEVYAHWRWFLGNMFDTDPLTIAYKECPTYEHALHLIDSLKITGFGVNSISRMQFANFLALEGICQHPTLKNMAAMTHGNNKGAFEGLILLGFDVGKAGESLP